MTTAALFLCLATALATSDSVHGACVGGDNLSNQGGSCNFDSSTLNLCDWIKPEGNGNLTWIADYDNVYLSHCISTSTAKFNINQILRLRSPLLCATNSTFFTYTLKFFYSMYYSGRCRFSLTVSSESGDKLTEIWNTQERTFDPRTRGWKSVSKIIDNGDAPFYIVFAAERISAAETVTLLLDTITYTSQAVTTTTTTTTTTATTTTTTETTTPPPTTTTTLPTTTTTPPTTTTMTTATTTTPTTTSTTTTTTTTRPPPPTTTTKPTTTIKTTTALKGALTEEDDTIIWGLTLEYVITIGAGVVVLLICIVVIAVCCCVCRRPKREEDVQTTSFALSSPTAYDVNEDPGKKKPAKTAKTVLSPSKNKIWQPDMTLY